MEELNELLTKYKENLAKAEENLTYTRESFLYLNINQDILSQVNMEFLAFLEKNLNKLSLTDEELKEAQEAFEFYDLNQDLDLTKLIIRDSKCLSFTDTIEKLYIKMLKYEETIILNYQREIERYSAIIKPFDVIKGLFQSTSEIDINNLTTLLDSLPLTKDVMANILSLALSHNLKICQQNSERIEDTEEIEVIHTGANQTNDSIGLNIIDESKESNESLEIDEKVIDSYIRKIDYLLSSLLKNVSYNQDIYITQSRLVELRDELNKLSQDYKTATYELSNEGINLEEQIYLQAVLEDIKGSIQKNIAEIEKISLELFEIDEPEEVLMEDGKRRNLIFLNSSFKDLEQFKKDVCQINIIKKVYSMLNHLKNDEILLGSSFYQVNSSTPINEFKGITNSKGAPRIFYQIIDDQVIILLMGIVGKHDQFWFKNTVEERIKPSLKSEYNHLMQSFRLASISPTVTSVYNNALTNQEYLNYLLEKYQEVEQQFFEKFHSECYNPDEKTR